MSLVTFPRQFLVDANGTPRVGAKANFYQAGTSTPITVYTTPDFDTPHSNPVLSVAGGLFPAVYVDPSVNEIYKVVITDSSDASVYSEDNISALGTPAEPRYDVTDAETAASVDPSDLSEVPGNIQRTGATDGENSSTAIQDAINQGELSTGAAVAIPHGQYVLNDSLTADGVLSIYGTGYYSELELPNAATHRALLIQHPTFAALNGVRLRDFRVDGNAGGAFDSGLITFNNGVGFIVDGVWIENGSRTSGTSAPNGISVSVGSVGQTGPQGVISSCMVQANAKAGINITTECVGVAAVWNISRNNTGNGSAPGLQINGAFRTKAVGNWVYGNQGRGIYAAVDEFDNPPTYSLVAFNHVYGNGTGTSEGDGIAVINADTAAHHARAMLVDNFVVDNGDGLVSGGSGVVVTATKSVDVRGQWIYDNALHGVLLSAQGAVAGGHIRVVDNIIDSNNVKGNSSGAGVFVIGTFDTLEISRNKISNPDAASRHRYGIYIDDTSVINDLTIKDNDITEMVTANHYFGAGGASIRRFDISVQGRHQTDDANQDTVFAFPLPDDSAAFVELSAVGCKSDGSKVAGYKTAALVYRNGAGATIQNTTETSLFEEETDADYDASISVTGNLIVVLIRGDTGDTVNWRWKVNAYSV